MQDDKDMIKGGLLMLVIGIVAFYFYYTVHDSTISLIAQIASAFFFFIGITSFIMVAYKRSLDPGWVSLQQGKELWRSAQSWPYQDSIISPEASAHASDSDIIQAKELITKAITLSPSSNKDPSRALVNKALAYEERGLVYRVVNQFDEAEKDFLESATILHFLGDVDSANLYVINALRETSFRLGELYHIKGQKDKAKEHYNKALKCDERLNHNDLAGEQLTKSLLGRLES